MSTIPQGDNIRTLIINRDAIPYRADIRLEGITYTLEFHYNHLHDYFTVDLWRQGVALAKGEKIVYARRCLNICHLITSLRCRSCRWTPRRRPVASVGTS